MSYTKKERKEKPQEVKMDERIKKKPQTIITGNWRHYVDKRFLLT